MTTKLDAVNAMLRAIGESPVSSLESGVPDAEQAENILDATVTDVLAIGWQVNTDEAVELAPDVNGFVVLADTILSIDTVGRDRLTNVVPRTDRTDGKRKLWNIKDRTFVFARPLLCRVVHRFEYDELTQGLKRYIAQEAALRFQADMLGSNSLDAKRQQRAAMALAALQDEEAANDGANILTSSPHCRYITQRNNVLFGR